MVVDFILAVEKAGAVEITRKSTASRARCLLLQRGCLDGAVLVLGIVDESRNQKTVVSGHPDLSQNVPAPGIV
jgi:hypothetical protein